jgi:nucleoside-diphosphate-sugar epimerase
MNMIHVDDIVSVILRMMNAKESMASGVYNLSDDTPTQKEMVVEWLADQLDLTVPTFDKDLLSQRNASRKTRTKNRRIANTKLKEALGFALKYPSYKEGYSQIIRQLS